MNTRHYFPTVKFHHPHLLRPGYSLEIWGGGGGGGRDRQRERQRDRQRQTDTDREREGERDRDRDRDRHTERDRKTERERERERMVVEMERGRVSARGGVLPGGWGGRGMQLNPLVIHVGSGAMGLSVKRKRPKQNQNSLHTTMRSDLSTLVCLPSPPPPGQCWADRLSLHVASILMCQHGQEWGIYIYTDRRSAEKQERHIHYNSMNNSSRVWQACLVN